MKSNKADGILLSGGLDTSIIATVASEFMSLKAITIAFQHAPAPDIEYAIIMAKRLNLEHYIHYFSENELYDALPNVIKVMKSFDPMEIRNSVVIDIGLRISKERGIKTILTGDGADELFAGYSYLFAFEDEELANELKKLWTVMQFSSIPLAKTYKMQAKLPFLSPPFKEFAMNLNPLYKIQTRNAQKVGKWILRKTYETKLPKEVVWRKKTPIETGSGTTTLPNFFNHRISDKEFNEKKNLIKNEDRVTIRNKEHLFYYEIFKQIFGIPHGIDSNNKNCPHCNSNVLEKSKFCRTCGAYPI